jgi:colanic acid/amylovoran biosynthesis glycosyltransferase
MHICYLTTEYPKVSHTFIRNEILEVERLGVTVARVAVRGWAEPVVDGADIEEKTKTWYLLGHSIGFYLREVLEVLVRSPAGLLRGLIQAVALSRKSNRGLVYHLAYLLEACVLANITARENIPHIHVHFATNAAEVALLAKHMSGVTYSLTVHGSGEFDRPEYLSLDKKIQSASFVRAISSFTKGQLMRWSAPEDWDRISVIRCGVDRRFLEPIQPATPEPTGGIVLVGRIDKHKGHLVMLDALAALRRSGTVITVTFAGDGDMREFVEERARQLGLADQVRFTGWISNDDVVSLVRSSAGVVLPSFAEGVPMVLIEAMASARPVIATYVGGVPELIDASCGWLVPVGDASQLAEALKNCISLSPEERRLMGEAGRARAALLHDPVRSATELVRLLEGAVRTEAAPSTSGKESRNERAGQEAWKRS